MESGDGIVVGERLVTWRRGWPSERAREVATDPAVYAVDDDAELLASIGVQVQAAGWAFHGYGSAESFLADYEPGKPGCLLLDIRLPGTSGLELQSKLVEMSYPIPIIAMSGYSDIDAAVRCLKAGALDYLQKPLHRDVLLRSIDVAIAQDRLRRKEHDARAVFEVRYDTLTPRETEVLDRILDGMSTKQIAELLSVSRRTVEKHRERIMRKMQAESASNLILMAVDAGVFNRRQ